MKVDLSKKIKEKLFDIYTTRILKKNARRVENLGFKNAVQIGIIYKYNSSFQHNVINFIKKLKKHGLKVKSICFVEEGQKDFNYQCPAFSYKDISMLGTILDAEIEKFIGTAYDYLFYIDFNANCIIRYLIAKSKAKCKIGFYNQEFSSLLDLMVNFNVIKNTILNKNERFEINDDLQSKVMLLNELMRYVETI